MEESKEKQNKGTASADPLKTYLESTQEFFDTWMNNYQSTFGKLTQVPAFGPVREKQEKVMKGFPIYVNLYNTWVESNINFQTVFTEAMKKTYEKMIIESKGEITTTKYKDFYKIWLETYSQTLKEFMKSGHFTADMGKLMTNFMDYQKYNKDMIEENVLKPCNLPTKTDIDEINKDLYTLRKTLKDLDKKTNEISKTIGEHRQKVLDDLDSKNNEISKRMDEISTRIDDLSKKIDNQKIDNQRIEKIDIKLEDIKLELDKKITQPDLDKKIAEISKKTKTDIQLELDKKITQPDLDKKIAEISKKTKTEIQLDIDKKIFDASKKTKTEIQTNLDNKISEISKKIDEQKVP